MRTVRSRTRITPLPSGQKSFHLGGVISNIQLNGGDVRSQKCNDSFGRPIIPSALSIIDIDCRGLSGFTGTAAYAGGYYLYENYLPGQYSTSMGGSHLSISGVPTPSSSAPTLLARTNPSRGGSVVPLTLLQDLYDIPKMVRDLGRLLLRPKSIVSPRVAASQYLGLEFGWLPLIQDYQEICRLGQSIAKRHDELSRLYSSRGLKRRVHLGSWSSSTPPSRVAVEAFGVTVIYAMITQSTSIERWGTVRWKPSSMPRVHPSDEELWAKARQVALGLTPEATAKGAWDLLPWTWVVNWFTNVADFALQFSNTVPALPSESCVMTQTTTTYEYSPQNPKGLSGGDGVKLYTTKERYVGSGSLTVHLPYIDGWKLSIISALGVQRFLH